jgi:uncharacterized protein (TIGR00369 family)
MKIWQREFDLKTLNQTSENTLMSHLGIQYSHFNDTSLSGTMPVMAHTHQPMGLLHGGASVVLAETLGSLAGNLCVPSSQYCVGLDIQANHIRSVKNGKVIGTANAIHLGKRTQVWQIDIVDEAKNLICTSRLTLAIMTKN